MLLRVQYHFLGISIQKGSRRSKLFVFDQKQKICIKQQLCLNVQPLFSFDTRHTFVLLQYTQNSFFTCPMFFTKTAQYQFLDTNFASKRCFKSITGRRIIFYTYEYNYIKQKLLNLKSEIPILINIEWICYVSATQTYIFTNTTTAMVLL